MAEKLIAKICSGHPQVSVCMVLVDSQKNANATKANARWLTGRVSLSQVPKSQFSAAFGLGGMSNTGDIEIGKAG